MKNFAIVTIIIFIPHMLTAYEHNSKNKQHDFYENNDRNYVQHNYHRSYHHPHHQHRQHHLKDHHLYDSHHLDNNNNRNQISISTHLDKQNERINKSNDHMNSLPIKKNNLKSNAQKRLSINKPEIPKENIVNNNHARKIQKQKENIEFINSNTGIGWFDSRNFNTIFNNHNDGTFNYNPHHHQDNEYDLHDVEIFPKTWSNRDSFGIIPTTTTTTTTTPKPFVLSPKEYNFNESRHICIQHKTIQVPVKTREIYSRPTWKHITEPCEENQICTRVKLVHEPVYRDIVRHKATKQILYDCCPGWERITKTSPNCLKPICKTKCKNGGTCIEPDTCNCPKGFIGKYCEQDVNECEIEKPCDQICINTEGSYYCECRDGFNLMNDRQSCKTTNKDDEAFEARDLENDVEQTDILNNRIEKLEKMIANDRIATNELYKNYQVTSHLVDSLKTRLSTLEKQQKDITSLQEKLFTNDNKTKNLEYLVNILLKCQKNPLNCRQM